MKNSIAKAVAIVTLLSTLASLLTGCFLKDKAVDGSGTVNYEGLLLDALRGSWCESNDGSYSLVFWDDYTLTMSNNYEPLIEDAALKLYTASANTDEYCEFDIKPNVFTDEAGGSVEITKASHENGVVTLELAASDGTKSVKTFDRVPENTEGPQMLDGPGMYYDGGILNAALTGCWYSADGRFVLDFNGQYADFSVDGELLVSKDNGYFVDHSYSADDDLNERCELYPTGNFIDDMNEPPFTISEMWYQAEHIYMNIGWPEGNTDEVVFSRQYEAVPEGERAQTPDTAQSTAALAVEEAAPTAALQTAAEETAPAAAPQTITMESNQGDGYMTLTFSALPATFEEFSALADTKLQNPENTCALFLLALNMYTRDKDAGLKAIDVLRGPRPMNGFDTQFIRDRLRDKTYLPLAYFDGATPQNSYTPQTPYVLRLFADSRPQDCEAGYMRVFLKTAGADSPRPIKLRQKGDEWFLWEYSSVLSGIRIPAAADPWA